MRSSYRQKSELVQQLCQHITNLQKINTSLHQNIAFLEQQKDTVCQYYQFSSWEALVNHCSVGKKENISQNKHSPKNCHFSYMKRTGLNLDNAQLEQELSQVNSLNEDTKKSAWYSTNPEGTFRKSIIDKLAFDSENNQNRKIQYSPQSNKHQQPITQCRHPLSVIFPNSKTFLSNKNNVSPFESPIQSQSRIINKSIRGDTYHESYDLQKQQQSLELPSFANNDNMLNQQSEMMLLSIHNTKLRQQLKKLEAIIQSKQICEDYYSRH